MVKYVIDVLSSLNLPVLPLISSAKALATLSAVEVESKLVIAGGESTKIV